MLFLLQGTLRAWLIEAITMVQAQGTIGLILFAVLYIVATVAALPASLLTLAAGLLYGPYTGAVLVLFASVTGAVAAFLLARSWLRPWVEGRYGDSVAFRTIAAKTEEHGAKLVFLLRLSPLVPFSILNYLLGLTSVSLRGYTLASVVGMVPGILLYTHLGASLGSLSELGTGVSFGGGWLFWMGLAATLLVTIILGRWSAQALRGKSEVPS